MSEAWDDLEQHLIGDEPDLADLPALGDIAHVERLLRGVAWRRRKIEQARHLVGTERQRLTDWLSEQEHRYDPAFHLAVLEQYHRARLARDPKAKTISLPSGSLVARKLPDRWEFDDDAFLAWAQDHRTDLVRMRDPEVDKPAAKKALRVLDDGQIIDGASGEFVPAVTVTPGDISFAVKTEEQDS